MKETFFAAFFSLVRLFLNTKDDFLKQKLVEKTKSFFDSAQSPIGQHGDSVAQCDLNFLKLIDELNEFIEILIHLETVLLSPALLTQKNLLQLKSEIMNSVSEEPKIESGTSHIKGPTFTVDKSKNKAKNSKYKNLEREILRLFKDKPSGLSLREIIPFLSSKCSRRTLQRYLNKLIAEGVVLKKGTNNSARYILHGHHVL